MLLLLLPLSLSLSFLLPFASSASSPPPGYGLNLATGDYASVLDLGFNWVKIYWVPGATPHNLGLNVLVRIEVDANTSFADLDARLAPYLADKEHIDAYEIGNEPNLDWAWGADPDPVAYVELLKYAYTRIKAEDPTAIVVSAGLATVGPWDRTQHPAYPHVWNDLLFIEAMYQAGAKGYFDALGSHPYGFAYAPETDPTLPYVNGLAFRRAEQQHQVMVEYGDSQTPIWATEWGWLLDPASEGYDCSWPSRDWQKVDPATQADYLARAFDYAYANWPWMGPMFVFNLDFARVYDTCNDMSWYSLLDFSGNPRQAYQALKAMPKHLDPIWGGLPASIGWMITPADRGTHTSSFTIRNEGRGTLTWTATTDAGWVTVTPSSGQEGERITVTADSTAFGLGSYTATLTLTGPEGMPDRVRAIPVHLWIRERVYRVYLANVLHSAP